MAKRNQVFRGAPEDFEKRDKKLIDVLLLESERGSVLAATAVIEEDLEILLRKRFSNDRLIIKNIIDHLFSGFGPLSTFSAKINIAYALNLIDTVLYKDLENIRSHCCPKVNRIDSIGC